MKTGLRRSGERGLSLIEILMAIMVLTAAIMAVATVYPGGYKLNETNRYANQATEIARGIMEEICALPFITPAEATSNPTGSLGRLSLSGNTAAGIIGLDSWDPTMSNTYNFPYHYYGEGTINNNKWKEQCPVLCWDSTISPSSIKSSLKSSNKLSSTSREGLKFFLPPSGYTTAPKGISINKYPADSTQWFSTLPLTSSRLAKIEVTVAWVEFRNDAMIEKYITIDTWRTDNKR